MSHSFKLTQRTSVDQGNGTSSSNVSQSSSVRFTSDGGNDGDIAVSVSNAKGTASFEGTGSRVSIESKDDGPPEILVDEDDEDVVVSAADDDEDQDLGASKTPTDDLEEEGMAPDTDAPGGAASNGAGGFDFSAFNFSTFDFDGADGGDGHASQNVSVMGAIDLFLS